MLRWCLLLVAACGDRSAYVCSDSSECVLDGAHGVCEPAGFCSFPDSSCPGGRRYEPNAGDGLGGTCPMVDAALGNDDADIDSPFATPIAFIQTEATSFDAPTGTLAFDSPIAAHDSIIVCADFSSAQAPLEITDSLGNHYKSVGELGHGTGYNYIFAAFDVAGGADTVTFTFPIITNAEVYIHEYAGLVRFDGGSSGDGTTAAVDGMVSGTVDTSGPNDLIFGFGSTGRATVGTGFTLRQAFHSNLTEDRVEATQGTYQATATMANGTDWIMMMAAFKGF